MGNYTPEQVQECVVMAEQNWPGSHIAGMLRDYATLRQQAGGVDEDAVVASFVEQAGAIISGKPFPGGEALAKARQIADLALASFAALAQNTQGDGEAIKYEHRMRPTWRPEDEGWSPWEQVSEGMYLDCLANPIVHEWQHEVRALYLHAERARVPAGWSGWCTQYPDRLPKLWGAREIAELNYYPEEGQRMFQVVEVAVAPSQRAEVNRAR